MTSSITEQKRHSAERDVLYDARYFEQELHRDHWFKNNAAKRARRWREVVRMLDLRPSDRILEIGCATGEHSLRLARIASHVVGIDFAPDAIERARARAKHDAVTNATFEVCDATNLARFDDCSYDKVAAIDFVEHVDDRALATILDEAYRVLVPGGRLAIYTPCATHYVEWLKAHNLILKQLPVHIAVREPEAYRELLTRAGMIVSSLWFSPSDYPLFGHLDRLLALVPWIDRWFHFRICLVAAKPA